MRSSRVVPIVAACALVLAGCHKKPQVAPTPAPPPPIDSTAIKQHIADSIAAANAARQAAEEAAARARADSIAQAEAARQAALRTTLTSMIHFDFNKADLKPEDQSTLDQKVAIMLANPNLMIRIAGNCDERGSEAYNLVLGQRRAAAAKRYMTDHGVADGNIEIISYGKERPLCTEHDESCWSQNRRDEFTITGGDTGTLNPPAGS